MTHQPRGHRADWPQKVKAFLGSHPLWCRTCAEIAEELTITDPKDRKMLSGMLDRMAVGGELKRKRQHGETAWRYAP